MGGRLAGAWRGARGEISSGHRVFRLVDRTAVDSEKSDALCGVLLQPLAGIRGSRRRDQLQGLCDAGARGSAGPGTRTTGGNPAADMADGYVGEQQIVGLYKGRHV